MIEDAPGSRIFGFCRRRHAGRILTGTLDLRIATSTQSRQTAGNYRRTRPPDGGSGLREGVYTPGQIDVPWTEAIKADFFKWLESRPERPPIPKELIEKQL